MEKKIALKIRRRTREFCLRVMKHIDQHVMAYRTYLRAIFIRRVRDIRVDR